MLILISYLIKMHGDICKNLNIYRVHLCEIKEEHGTILLPGVFYLSLTMVSKYTCSYVTFLRLCSTLQVQAGTPQHRSCAMNVVQNLLQAKISLLDVLQPRRLMSYCTRANISVDHQFLGVRRKF